MRNLFGLLGPFNQRYYSMIYSSFILYRYIIKYIGNILFKMTYAILDLHTSVEDNTALKDGELKIISFSGLNTDTVCVSSNTFSKMERDMDQIFLKGICFKINCIFSSQHKLRLQQHVKSYYALHVCTCGYFESYRDTTTKHQRTWHHVKQTCGYSGGRYSLVCHS